MTRLPTEDGNGATQPREDDTGQTSIELHATLSEVGAAPPAAQPADVLELLAEKVARKMGNGGSSPPPAPKKFLGVGHDKWVMMLAGLLVTGVGLALTWVLFVRDDLKSLRGGQEHHEVHGHDKTNDVINDIQKVQTVQGVQLENIDRGIGEIKDKLK